MAVTARDSKWRLVLRFADNSFPSAYTCPKSLVRVLEDACSVHVRAGIKIAAVSVERTDNSFASASVFCNHLSIEICFDPCNTIVRSHKTQSTFVLYLKRYIYTCKSFEKKPNLLEFQKKIYYSGILKNVLFFNYWLCSLTREKRIIWTSPLNFSLPRVIYMQSCK